MRRFAFKKYDLSWNYERLFRASGYSHSVYDSSGKVRMSAYKPFKLIDKVTMQIRETHEDMRVGELYVAVGGDSFNLVLEGTGGFSAGGNPSKSNPVWYSISFKSLPSDLLIKNKYGQIPSDPEITDVDLSRIVIGSTEPETVIALDGTYPDRGTGADGFWYVKGEQVNEAPQIAFNQGQGISTAANQTINIGDKTAPFNFGYNVTDADGDKLTVKTYLDGVLKSVQENVSSGASLTLSISKADFEGLDFSKSHDLKITATDTDATSTAILRFNRSNLAPEIRWASGQGITDGSNVSQDLGERNEAFSYTYRISDPEKHPLTLTTSLKSNSVGTIVLDSASNAPQNTDRVANVTAEHLAQFPIGEPVALEVKVSDGTTTSYSTLTFKRTNEAPVITTSQETYQDLEGGLNIAYTVADPNDDDVVVKWFINNSNVEAGSQEFTGPGSHEGSITMDHKAFIAISPGVKNTVRIEATDSKGAVKAKTIYFYRVVKKLHVRGKFNSPMIDAAIEELYVACIMSYTEGAKVSIKMCNNINDIAPTWEDVTVPILNRQMTSFVNRTKTAESYGIGFELIIEKGEAPEGWSAWFASMGASLPAPII